MLIKSIKVSLYLSLFLMLIVGGINAYAGADPDEVFLEEEAGIQDIVKQEVVTIENETQSIDVEEIVAIIDDCVSFPEAIAFKEHFACKMDIEKNRVARSNWSFAKLIVAD
ncbi:MAG: hypothetical protein HN613_04850 [Gammaproteobacteria bacterium]|nr:hypothetical protein [Gammaproteobacteria bacterium]MBT7603777.1 hypothetical protein [Gammaproteobacteria bacterium]